MQSTSAAVSTPLGEGRVENDDRSERVSRIGAHELARGARSSLPIRLPGSRGAGWVGPTRGVGQTPPCPPVESMIGSSRLISVGVSALFGGMNEQPYLPIRSAGSKGAG